MNLKRIEEVGEVSIMVDADTGDLYAMRAIEGLKEAVQEIARASRANKAPDHSEVV